MTDILNLGAGNKLVAGAVQHDLTKHRPEIDVVHDLNVLPWPWDDNSFDLVVACAVFEHLRNTLIETVNECWRILRPGGVLHMKLPYWHSDNSFRDPTHFWHFSLYTCDLFDPTTKYGREYAFYGVRPWRIVQPARLNKAKTSFAVKLQVVKTAGDSPRRHGEYGGEQIGLQGEEIVHSHDTRVQVGDSRSEDGEDVASDRNASAASVSKRRGAKRSDEADQEQS